MNRIIIKVSHKDREIHKIALELYLYSVGNMMDAYNTALHHVQYSLLWCLHNDLEKYFKKREHPQKSTLKLDPHNAHTLRDALLYLMNNSDRAVEKAKATRLFTQIDSMLSNTDKDCYLLS